MITLDNFENFVSYKILMPGEEYYDTDEEEVVQPDVDIKQLLSFISPQEISNLSVNMPQRIRNLRQRF